MSSAPTKLAPGIWRWTARHPEWHPGEFGAEVAAFAVDAGDDLLLIDPIVPEDDSSELLDLLDRLADGRTTSSLITIGYHVRDAEQLAKRYGGAICGPPTCAKRLKDEKLLTDFTPDVAGPAGARAF